MAIEITTKPKIRFPLWVIFLAVFTFLAYGASGFAYWYFNSLTAGLNSQIQEKSKALEETDSERQLENYIFSKEQKINSFSALLSSHKKDFNIFTKLESLTHPDVQFTDFAFSVPNNKIKMQGVAKNFYSLGQQALIFKQDPDVKEKTFGGITIDKERGISFSVEITFNPQIFQ